jgi:hypothetical protein
MKGAECELDGMLDEGQKLLNFMKIHSTRGMIFYIPMGVR